MIRRRFLAALALVSGVALAQKAVMQGDHATVCESEPIKCPLGHDTCKVIDAPVVVGNDNYQYPDVGQLSKYHLLRCNTCKVLFTKE